MTTNASNESKTFKSVRRAGWLTSWGRAGKSQRGFADSCGAQRAWREEIKNVLIWSTGLSKERQGRCLSSEPERRDKERKQDSQGGDRGNQQRCGGKFNQKPSHLGKVPPLWHGKGQRTPKGLNLKGVSVFLLKSHTGSWARNVCLEGTVKYFKPMLSPEQIL